MTRTQYYTATSIDGFIADEHNSLDWLFEVESNGGDRFAPFFSEVGAFAMGATTYEWVLAHEKLLETPDKWFGWYGERRAGFSPIVTCQTSPGRTSDSSAGTWHPYTLPWSKRQLAGTSGWSAAVSW